MLSFVSHVQRFVNGPKQLEHVSGTFYYTATGMIYEKHPFAFSFEKHIPYARSAYAAVRPLGFKLRVLSSGVGCPFEFCAGLGDK